MEYKILNFENLLGTEGFSDKLLKDHFTLYQGYVKNTNTLIQTFEELAKDGKAGTPAHAELKRRFGWEFNGMRLHELYFGNMKKGGIKPDAASPLGKLIAANFGSYENWEKSFKACATARGIGWTALYFDQSANSLFNTWINEHDGGHLAGCVPMLILDVFEHAFLTDYGLKRADYIESFFKAIDWNTASERLKKAK